MSAKIIDGRAVADRIHEETRARIQKLQQTRGITPGLAVVLVGDNPASAAYIRMKDRAAAKLGIYSERIHLPGETSETDLLKLVEDLNRNPKVHGILIQSPVPKQISEGKIQYAISPEKDVDGFHPLNMGKLALGDDSGFRPCTPAGIHELLIHYGIPTEGANVAILGRGKIVGKPMALILQQKGRGANATVTLLHSASKNIAEITRKSDIVIAAMGQAFYLKADMISPGATIIDVGVNRISDPSSERGFRLVGDVDYEALLPIAGHITPNPGGVGPMTIAMLMSNTVLGAERGCAVSA